MKKFLNYWRQSFCGKAVKQRNDFLKEGKNTGNSWRQTLGGKALKQRKEFFKKWEKYNHGTQNTEEKRMWMEYVTP